MNDKKSLLLVVDVQNDFCPGGKLAVEKGDEIVPIINSIMNKFTFVAATQDWHPAGHMSFASSHQGKKPFDQHRVDGIEQTLWPDHCVQGTKGADFHPSLNTVPCKAIIRKGDNPRIDSYSAMLENDKKTATGLKGYLESLGVKKIFICGLATDYCVFFSAMDLADAGFKTTVIIDACRGIDVPAGSIENAIAAMKAKGIEIMNYTDIQ